MKKMQANGYIEDLSITDKAIGVAGFLAAFSFTRWFKNNDSVKERLRHLETDVSSIKTTIAGHEKSFALILDEIKTLQKQRKEDHDYMHTIKHSFPTEESILNVKEGIFDNMHNDIEEIKQLLKDKE